MDEYYAESYAISEHPKCHFRGQIVGKETSAVALSTCNPGEMVSTLKNIITISIV